MAKHKAFLSAEVILARVGATPKERRAVKRALKALQKPNGRTASDIIDALGVTGSRASALLCAVRAMDAPGKRRAGNSGPRYRHHDETA